MPSLGFTVFREKILDGSKTQTIRRARKRIIHAGERLYLYWGFRTKACQSLLVGRCVAVMRLPYSAFKNDEGIARLDGFASAEEMRAFLERVHDKNVKPPTDETLFDIIRWEVI